jgi:exonuclease 3'-5' domain-containing protein 1
MCVYTFYLPFPISEFTLPIVTAHVADVATLMTLLDRSHINDSFPTGLVNTCTAISGLIDIIVSLCTSPLSLYLDLEGVNLSRHGSVCILQAHNYTDGRTCIIDIHTLGDKISSTVRTSGQTLKGILESDSIPKVFFDIRNDLDILFSHVQIRLASVHDL